MMISRHGTKPVHECTWPSASASPSQDGAKATDRMIIAKNSRLILPCRLRGLTSRSSASMEAVSSDA